MLTSIRAGLAITLAVFPGVGFAQTKADEPIKMTLCELVKEPERFNGKMVHVRAAIVTGFEASLLRDDSCSASIWLAGPGATYTTIGNQQTPNRQSITVKLNNCGRSGVGSAR